MKMIGAVLNFLYEAAAGKLNLTGRLAERILRWRLRQVEQNSVGQQMGLKEAALEELSLDGGSFALEHPGVAVLAEQLAALLNSSKAENYVEVMMRPRLDRGLRPVRLTVQWEDGKSPARKAAALEKDYKELEQNYAVLEKKYKHLLIRHLELLNRRKKPAPEGFSREVHP